MRSGSSKAAQEATAAPESKRERLQSASGRAASAEIPLTDVKEVLSSAEEAASAERVILAERRTAVFVIENARMTAIRPAESIATATISSRNEKARSRLIRAKTAVAGWHYADRTAVAGYPQGEPVARTVRIEDDLLRGALDGQA